MTTATGMTSEFKANASPRPQTAELTRCGNHAGIPFCVVAKLLFCVMWVAAIAAVIKKNREEEFARGWQYGLNSSKSA